MFHLNRSRLIHWAQRKVVTVVLSDCWWEVRKAQWRKLLGLLVLSGLIWGCPQVRTATANTKLRYQYGPSRTLVTLPLVVSVAPSLDNSRVCLGAFIAFKPTHLNPEHPSQPSVLYAWKTPHLKTCPERKSAGECRRSVKNRLTKCFRGLTKVDSRWLPTSSGTRLTVLCWQICNKRCRRH